MDNHEYKIYVEIAHEIFQKCFEVHHIAEERGWTNELSELLEEASPGNHLTKKALSDLYGRINRLRGENETFLEMGISEKTLNLLSQFAKIDNYKALNRGYRGIMVFYTPKPFRFFNLLRIPIDGVLYKNKGAWVFSSDGIVLINSVTITNAVPYCMPGDHFSFWVKIAFKSQNGDDQTAYFSQFNSENTHVNLLNPEKLLAFFKEN
jgi:hypothetical protein